jgi:hypothetical protein
MRLVFVGGIHEHETCDTLGVVGSEDADVETSDGGADENYRSANPAAGEKCGELACDPACRPRRRARIAIKSLELVSLTFASWNLIRQFLWQLDALKPAA